MPRKKKTADADAAPATTTEETRQPADTEPMVTILKSATAAKLSPRGGGELTYQIGRMENTVLLRISGNDSSGRFSKEWVPAQAIRRSISQLPRGASSFKGAVALRTAWKGQSSCNSGFGAAIMRAEGVFASDEDPKKKGMLKLAAPDALDQWEHGVLALPLPKDAERVLLNPPKPKPFFGKRNGDSAAAAPEPDNEPVDDVEQVDEPDEDSAEGDE